MITDASILTGRIPGSKNDGTNVHMAMDEEDSILFSKS